MDLLHFFSDHTLRVVAAGAALTGLTAAVLGSFAYLRRQSLIGDAVAHATLPGIALAFLVTGSKSLPILLAGALMTGLLGAGFIHWLSHMPRIRPDAALGLTLSIFFAGGLVLLTLIQHQPNAAQAGLDSFLFGQAAALHSADLWLMLGLAIVALMALALGWKEIKLTSFDPDFAISAGVPVRWIEFVLLGLLVLAIVIGLSTVGVVLMVALVVAPAAAARRWTRSLLGLVLLAGTIGATGAVLGALASASTDRLPTGPAIVLIIFSLFFISLFFGARDGLVWRWIRMVAAERRIAQQRVLAALFQLAQRHHDLAYPHAEATIQPMVPPTVDLPATLAMLERLGLVCRAGRAGWSLTASGIARMQATYSDITALSA